MCSPSPPPAPDYAAAAQQTAQGNKDAILTQTAANRVNQISPEGSLTYAITGEDTAGNPTWTATQQYSPDQQQIYQANTDLSKGLLGTAQQGLGKVDELMADPTIDESKLAQMPIQGQSVQDAIFSRLTPQLDRQQNQLETQLANQGITRGSEAWNNAMTDQSQSRNDLMTQAALQGINTGLTARQQGMQEQAYIQDRPLNVVNALRTGNQVQGPQFVSPPQQGFAPGADYSGAARDQYGASMDSYNANAAGNSSMMGGLFGIGSAALSSPWLMASDRRLKRNIKRIGTHNTGIGIYTWNYIWGAPGVGVMADEVEAVIPEAVLTDANGFQMVDYSKI
jgi:hypothetical protein